MIRKILMYGLGSVLMIVAMIVVVRAEDGEGFDQLPVVAVEGVVAAPCPRGTGGRVSCAYVVVPEDYADPDIRSIRLFTARVAPPTEASGVPLVFVGNGLGGETVSHLGDWQGIARTLSREIILVDLRGSGGSVPRLSCPDLKNQDWLEVGLQGAQFDASIRETERILSDCRDRLSQDVALGATSLDAMVEDLELVRQRFDVPEWVVGAGGDATVVARRFEELHGASVTSLVLFGAVASSANFHVQQYEFAREVLALALGPELSDRLDEVTAPLADRSIVFPVQAAGRRQRVAVSDETVHPTIARAVADPAFRAGIETFISERLAESQWRAIALLRASQRREILARVVPTRLAVSCGELGDAGAASLPDLIDDFDTRWTGLLDDPVLDPELCAAWEPVEHAEVSAPPTVPTLVVNGAFDVTAPGSAAQEIDAEWPSGNVVVVDDLGRPTFFDDCTIVAVQSFLSTPSRTLAGVCS